MVIFCGSSTCKGPVPLQDHQNTEQLSGLYSPQVYVMPYTLVCLFSEECLSTVIFRSCNNK